VSQALFSLEGRTALVTGASGGLGGTFARAAAQAGARVVLAARQTERVRELEAALRDAGAEVKALEMDVGEPLSVERAFARLEADGWLVDVVVNNAGLGLNQSWLRTDEATWTKLLQTNLLGADRVARAACTRLIAAGRAGTVINIASVLGLTVQPVSAAYGATKAALIHLTKKMAIEMARHRITVNCIAPGMFRTAMVEEFARSPRGHAYLEQALSRRMGEPDELVGTLLYLAGAASSYVTGVVIPVDGGNHLRSL